MGMTPLCVRLRVCSQWSFCAMKDELLWVASWCVLRRAAGVATMTVGEMPRVAKARSLAWAAAELKATEALEKSAARVSTRVWVLARESAGRNRSDGPNRC